MLSTISVLPLVITAFAMQGNAMHDVEFGRIGGDGIDDLSDLEVSFRTLFESELSMSMSMSLSYRGKSTSSKLPRVVPSAAPTSMNLESITTPELIIPDAPEETKADSITKESFSAKVSSCEEEEYDDLRVLINVDVLEGVELFPLLDEIVYVLFTSLSNRFSFCTNGVSRRLEQKGASVLLGNIMIENEDTVECQPKYDEVPSTCHVLRVDVPIIGEGNSEATRHVMNELDYLIYMDQSFKAETNARGIVDIRIRDDYNEANADSMNWFVLFAVIFMALAALVALILVALALKARRREKTTKLQLSYATSHDEEFYDILQETW